jgi:dCMP deaminase
MAISDADRQFLLRCERIKKDSHDPHRQVGVLIVDEHDQVVAVGTNAPPAEFGLSLSESHTAIETDPNWKYFMLEHAERNAINSARKNGKSLERTTMYGTLFPCADCARAIIAAGIARLVVPAPGNLDRDQKWLDHYRYSRQILELAGVRLDIGEIGS